MARGREVTTTGDGFLVVFDGPARAIRTAIAVRDRVSTVTMVARFGATREVTLDDLRVELIYPADTASRAFFERQPS